jgi:hypothetical protein
MAFRAFMCVCVKVGACVERRKRAINVENTQVKKFHFRPFVAQSGFITCKVQLLLSLESCRRWKGRIADAAIFGGAAKIKMAETAHGNRLL